MVSAMFCRRIINTMKVKTTRSDTITALFSRMNRAYFYLLSIVCIATFGIMSSVIAINTTHTISQRVNSLRKATIDSYHDWRAWEQNNVLNTDVRYVQVINKRRHRKFKSITTSETNQLINHSRHIIGSVWYNPKTHEWLMSAQGEGRQIYYHVWMNISKKVNTLLFIFIDEIILLIVIGILTPITIRRTVVEIVRPIISLRNTVTLMSSVTTIDELIPVPVPDNPTEVRQVAQAFNRLIKQLKRLNQQQLLFISNATHELKTPIATITSNIDLIKRHATNHPEVIQQMLPHVMVAVKELQSMVEKLLRVYQAKQEKLEVTAVNGTKLVNELMTRLRTQVPQKLNLDIAQDVPLLLTNASAITEIITNLITNAEKYTPVTGTITVCLQRGKGNAVIKVCDTGCGISATDQQHIFDPFYRAADVRGTVSGQGLGLSIVQQLSERLGVRVMVTSTLGQGSCFELDIPVEKT